MLPVKFQATAYRAVTEHYVDGDVWGRIGTNHKVYGSVSGQM